ncbi:MAG: DNA-processing protein DprA, partial [Acidimicrobiia bacterium]|nr:DNA-processing protein DprA [Acidimicrobiia bacterium]
RIEESGGALISEYPPGTPPDRWRFPARNRLIAAMSAAVVVVEAAESGGALITARLGAEIGRAVMAVPGDIDRPASVGANRLIRDGAIPVLGPGDLIEALSLIVGPPPRTPETDTPAGEIPSGGIGIEELGRMWGIGMAEVLARVGKMEVEGVLSIDGDRVIPV